MWGPGHEPAPVEKIRKAQWTVENTRATQLVVDQLEMARQALRLVTGNSRIVEAMTAASKRFQQLDPKIKLGGGQH